MRLLSWSLLMDDRRNHPRVELSTVAIVLARHNPGIAIHHCQLPPLARRLAARELLM